jgi:hypothetical protein
MAVLLCTNIVMGGMNETHHHYVAREFKTAGFKTRKYDGDIARRIDS